MSQNNVIINDLVHFYMSELTSNIIAESGIPSDRFHLGKIVLRNLKDDPDFVLQIDGATGESQTFGEALDRSVRCANALRHVGVVQGDVMVLMAPNHLELSMPYYAALYLGVIIAGVDRTLTSRELSLTLKKIGPKIIFCQSENVPDIQQTLEQISLNSQIVTFDNADGFLSFDEFLIKYGGDTAVEDFKPTDFNPEVEPGFLMATSGSTGLPKSAVLTHKNFAVALPYSWIMYDKFPTPIHSSLVCAPLQWITTTLAFLGSVVMKYTRIQSPLPLTIEHLCYLINKYKPYYTTISPTAMTALLKQGGREICDLTCFNRIMLCGSAVSNDLIKEIKRVTPHTIVLNIYGISETSGHVFLSAFLQLGSCGKPMGLFQYRLIDTETKEDITEPNVNGELWLKGPSIFKEYYKDPEATATAITEDGWFKTGDLLHRDNEWNFYFVDRIKMLLKYKSHQISPLEVENVICRHPGVADVVVSGVPDPECGDLCVACVVRRPGSQISAQEIKDLVAESLTDSKRLRGGVIFLKTLPLTSNAKVDRKKIKEIVLTMTRE